MKLACGNDQFKKMLYKDILLYFIFSSFAYVAKYPSQRASSFFSFPHSLSFVLLLYEKQQSWRRRRAKDARSVSNLQSISMQKRGGTHTQLGITLS